MIRPIHNPTDLAAGYILDNLSPEEFAQLNQSLAEGPALHEDIASFGEFFALIPYGMPIVEPSARLKDKILTAASQSITTPNLVPFKSKVASLAAPRRRAWKRWISAIGPAIAAVAVVAIGVNQVQLSRQSQQTVALRQKLDATDVELTRLRSELRANQSTIALLSQSNTQV